MRALAGWLRFSWAALTSMRTALVLLLVLGLAAIPGSLLPQRPSNPVGVADFLRANPVAGVWLDRLGFFDVFGSPWFAAIYLLLFVSLIGCILPRTANFLRALRAEPAPGPGRLDRLEGYRSELLAAPAPEVLAAAADHLRAKGYRVRRDAAAISAERGYVREAGNLVFHVCLVLALVGLAWGALFSFRGTAVVVEGNSFSNTLTQYDEFGAGAGFRGVVNVLEGTAFEGANKTLKSIDVPAELTARLKDDEMVITEASAEAIDELLEKFFSEGELSHDEVLEGFRAGMKSGKIVPVVCRSAVTAGSSSVSPGPRASRMEAK